jgi:hypothetical protein
VQSPFSVFNLMSTVDFTAPLDLVSFSGSGNTSALTTTLMATNNIAAGASQSFAALLDTSSLGSFSASYTLNLSDDTSLAGAVGGQQLTLNLLGNVVAVPEPASCLALLVGISLIGVSRRRSAK